MEDNKHKAKSKAELLAEKMQAQRVGKSAFEAGAKPIVETNPPADAPQTAQDALKTEKATEDTPKEEKPVTASPESQTAKKETKLKPKATSQSKKTASKTEEAAAPVKLLDKIGKKKREEKKSNAYYLTVKNMEELAKRAEKADMSASELLDSILTAVFSE